MDADLTPERLKQFIEIADPKWVEDQLVKYKAFREAHSPESYWSHRPPSMSPIIPLIYWSSREPYEPTGEPYMGYWWGEPKSILGRLTVKLLAFRNYWENLPNDIGLNNIRWFLRTPGRFASFEHEIRTADVYKFETTYEVEPCFFDPRSKRGDPDIILRKDNQVFNVQCKAMDPSSSSTMPFELFQYLVGCLGRISQDFDIHSYLTVFLKKSLNMRLARRDVDFIISQVRGLINSRQTVTEPQPFRGGKFIFKHSPSKKPLRPHTDQFTMWTGGYLFQERRILARAESRFGELDTVCKVSGGKFPSFESYVYPMLEEAASKASTAEPLIICLHLYPPLPVHSYQHDAIVQKKVLPDLREFFDRNQHVCLVLISSYAQIPFRIGEYKQRIGTPVWEVESQHWSGERPDSHSTV